MGTRTLKKDDPSAKRYEDIRKANLEKPIPLPDKEPGRPKPTVKED